MAGGAKGRPFSVRFRLPADHFVEAEARRTRRSKSDLVEALTEEAILTRRFAGVAFRGEDWSRRPWVIGSGLDVWEIVDMLRSYEGDVARLVDDNDLEERHVRLALAYYEQHREEIDGAVAENRRGLDELHQLYPFVELALPRA